MAVIDELAGLASWNDGLVAPAVHVGDEQRAYRVDSTVLPAESRSLANLQQPHHRVRGRRRLP
jgi:hypothetical protein